MEAGYSKWRKLDNAALAFPLVTGKNDTRVFRFYCQLKEEVAGEVLQTALDQTMEKYPLFQTVLRKGLFWFYLEHRDHQCHRPVLAAPGNFFMNGTQHHGRKQYCNGNTVGFRLCMDFFYWDSNFCDVHI